jgi:hypothetical protein
MAWWDNNQCTRIPVKQYFTGIYFFRETKLETNSVFQNILQYYFTDI